MIIFIDSGAGTCWKWPEAISKGDFEIELLRNQMVRDFCERIHEIRMPQPDVSGPIIIMRRLWVLRDMISGKWIDRCTGAVRGTGGV